MEVILLIVAALLGIVSLLLWQRWSVERERRQLLRMRLRTYCLRRWTEANDG